MKKIFITIPEPCHQKWEEMRPDEKGRFCNSCQKTVVDFSNMNDAQLAAFFREPPQSVCGRIQDSQLNRGIVIPRKPLPWARYFFQFALPAFLLSMKASSQRSCASRQTVASTSLTKKMGVPKALAIVPSLIIEGVILDTAHLPIPYATISIKNTTQATAADSQGRFRLESVSGHREIIVSATGFETVEQEIGDHHPVRIMLQPKVTKMEEVVISNRESHWLGGITWATRVTKSWPVIEKIKDTLISKLSVYPNPVQRNSNLTIQATGMELGDYQVIFFDERSALVQASRVSFQQKNQLVDLMIGNLSAGAYLIQLINKRTGKQYTKKLIVQ